MNWSARRAALRFPCLKSLIFGLLGLSVIAPLAFAAEPPGEPALVLQPERRLTSDGRLKESPVFIGPSGQEIAYVVQESPSLLRTMKLRLADGHSEPLTPGWEKNEFEPAFSVDGQWLATIQSRGNLSLALVIRPTNAMNAAEVRPEGGFCGYRSPAFTPDAQRVYYSFADEDHQGIYSVDRQGGDKKRIVQGPGHANWPCVTPDGTQLVFGSSREGNYDLYVSRLDGTEVRRLTDSPRQDIRPRVSPDGKWIAFTSARDGNYEIYVLGWDGSPPRRITNHPERDDYAAWHPNSRQLVIVSERAGKHDLYLVDLPSDLIAR